MSSQTVKDIISQLSNLTEDELCEIVESISQTIWIPQHMSKEYLETLVDKTLDDQEYEAIKNDSDLRDKIITYIDEEIQIKYIHCQDEEDNEN